MLCIIQDTTNSRTINERLTLNLPASTTLSKLHKDVAHKAGYMNGSFELAWGNAPNMVRRIIPFIQPAVKIQPYSLLLFSVASLYVQFMLPHSSFLQCWYTNQDWYQKSVETSDTELLEFLHCRSPSSCAVKRASHRFMTWEKPMRSEISLNVRHIHSSSFICFQVLNKSFYQRCSQSYRKRNARREQFIEISHITFNLLCVYSLLVCGYLMYICMCT